ncbi:hypothetical protein FGG08_004158 [Glutinoglossum americanum]|uniref:Putative gamma-glutamylcyclotransferase n=1 Tax=Glutinoglossum americanum TaxID=1670608 RepID=A0A9P8I5Q4_9PEZI|nr:hypothetical protein FGG08_004158 [Glutinoglossum americanum]
MGNFRKGGSLKDFLFDASSDKLNNRRRTSKRCSRSLYRSGLPHVPHGHSVNFHRPVMEAPPPPNESPIGHPIASLIRQRLKQETKPTTTPSGPGFCFFYGTLADPEILQSILKLQDPPVLQKGKIHGFKTRMWGIYPTLVPCDDGEVGGMVYRIGDISQFERLEQYETSSYRWCSCTIELDDGRKIEGGWTFCWAGELDSKDLEDGEFDPDHFQKYFKGSVVGKSPVSEGI